MMYYRSRTSFKTLHHDDDVISKKGSHNIENRSHHYNSPYHIGNNHSNPGLNHRHSNQEGYHGNHSRNNSYDNGHRLEQHKEGVAKAHHSIRLQPLSKPSNHNISAGSIAPSFPSPPESKQHTYKVIQGPYSEKLKRQYANGGGSSFQTFNARRSLINPSLRVNGADNRLSSDTLKDHLTSNGESSSSVPIYRSKTVPLPEPPKVGAPVVRTPAVIKMEKKAKKEAEKAIKQRKVFTILGPYHSLRQSLRRRGWVEKFQNMPFNAGPETLAGAKKKPLPVVTDDDDDDGMKRGHSAPPQPPGFACFFKTEKWPSKTLRIDGDNFWVKQEPQIKPWEEDNGMYAMMSRVVRNCTPTFVFSVKSCDVNSRVTKTNQLVNHYGKASTFTTKVGLLQNIRNVPWFDDVDPNIFFPRCYKVDEADEREAFIEDYRMTACFGFLKCFIEKYKDKFKDVHEEEELDLESIKNTLNGNVTTENENKENDLNETENNKDSGESSTASATSTRTEESVLPTDGSENSKKSSPGVTTTNSDDNEESGKESKLSDVSTILADDKLSPKMTIRRGGPEVSLRALEIAIQQCEQYIKFKEHTDIDIVSDREHVLSSSQWDTFINWYYTFVHAGGEITTVTQKMMRHCEQILAKVKSYWAQYHLDGFHNVWIMKPGAKSRGRGIMCANRMDTILASMESSDSMVFQKYIERPLLVYNTKFDIRQWFLVTDWNPLTIWFYSSCYLRFCSQEFTLDDFHESIHLSNNSIQKHYSINESRSEQLPEDNMWQSEEFEQFIRRHGYGEVWQEKIVPGMKRAIICVMQCTQEFIEARKSAFELYGADFMLTEDMNPWLIEINSSPSMARNTRVTATMVDDVLEDTLKVVLDRRQDKSADTGKFEMIYKQGTIPDPPPGTDASLAINGKKIKRKGTRR